MHTPALAALMTIVTNLAIVLTAAPAGAQAFDVTLEVDTSTRGGGGSDLAFTGAPLLVLLATAVLLLALGIAFVATSRRETPARA